MMVCGRPEGETCGQNPAQKAASGQGWGRRAAGAQVRTQRGL